MNSEEAKAYVQESGLEALTYTLFSSPMVFTPGIVKFAIHSYKWQPDLARQIMQTYGLPDDVIERLLTRKLGYREEADKVLIEDANF